MKNVKGAKGLIIVLVLVLMVVGYFYYLSNRDYADRHEEDVLLLRSRSFCSRTLVRIIRRLPRRL